MVKENKTKGFHIMKKVGAKTSNKRNTTSVSDTVKNHVKTSLVKKSNSKRQLHKCDKVEGKRLDRHKSEDREKSNMAQNIRKRKHRISPKINNVNKKMKITCLFDMDRESPQKFECFKHNVENAITILEQASQKLKDLKELNDVFQKRQKSYFKIIE